MVFESILNEIFEERDNSLKSLRETLFFHEKKYVEKDKYVWEIALPFFKKEEISLKVIGRTLILEGKVDESKKEDIEVISNTSYTAFKTPATIPAKFDLTSLDCSFKDGVLKVVIKEDKNFSKKIEIK